jgi:hypothetical protein
VEEELNEPDCVDTVTVAPLLATKSVISSDLPPSSAILRKSSRPSIPPARLTYDKDGRQTESREAHVSSADNTSPSTPPSSSPSTLPNDKTDSSFMLTPLTLKQAYASREAQLWKEAYEEEIKSLAHHDTYTWVQAPRGAHIVRSKLIFKIKPATDGKPIRFKVRGVACGYSQTQGVDYNEIFPRLLNIKLYVYAWL